MSLTILGITISSGIIACEARLICIEIGRILNNWYNNQKRKGNDKQINEEE